MASDISDIGESEQKAVIHLQPPRHDGPVSLEKALKLRRSVRRFSTASLPLKDIAQVLWAAQGITGSGGRRTSPSAGALYPLEIYLVSGQVSEIEAGIYRYRPHNHKLALVTIGDTRKKLAQASLRQNAIANAPATIAIFAVFERTSVKYGDRGDRYVHLEAGHTAQNICLQAVALNLGSVVIGAFHDREVKQVIGSKESEQPLYLIPIGQPK
jgi:SagB-type dehydrogenase family enzyme